ncbi:MAG: mannonate dehydratase [Paracoccaceae bacterium]
MKPMWETLRWHDPDDRVLLNNVKQTGATELVSAQHHIYDGSLWSDDAIARQMAQVEVSDLTWKVVESIPVHNHIMVELCSVMHGIIAMEAAT